ncbi:CDP-diacylglycerol--glycerol-3-phosphate 3-phosphatidyltransferase, mitochondrial [Takifugu flavidus]|uniref:CDP-diacylglycerol--glycerol-3-phosphate 3-phosphatidyltransferase, mitochondrial n=1 Tax=Takifugu flavidus TaxID=433684 RepID=A0A5C6MGI5_9TELE|nr:CDP-diacylglycerol--glycerol-3-phosphate 3-phosphatidyltransferase, mitochondrial [Takifugu flavidus]TWW54192.1 CDP-diacylglycerol--glycerol-3-phosphate 3-phosphatidyltransferase, mitochondrial [Takifugu flavidus]
MSEQFWVLLLTRISRTRRFTMAEPLLKRTFSRLRGRERSRRKSESKRRALSWEMSLNMSDGKFETLLLETSEGGSDLSDGDVHEQQRLYRRSTEVSSATFEQPDRHVQLWVKLVTPFIKNFF